MSIQRTRVRRVLPGLGMILAILLLACGCQESQEDRIDEWLETADRVLSEILLRHFDGPVYDTEWDFEHAERWLDDDRFPTWGRDDYDVCVYWSATFWTEVYNNDRRPGNSSVFIQKPGRGWGWILLKDQGFHILELGYEFDEDASDPTMLIDVWELPTDDSPVKD